VSAVADPVGAPDDNASYVQGSNTVWDDIIYSMGPMTDAVEITQVKMFVRYNNAGAGAGQEIDYGIRIGGVNYLNGTLSPAGAYADSTKTWTVNPATGSLFTKPQLDDIQIIIRTQDTSGAVDSVRLTQTYLEVTYQPIPAGINPAREIASHRLRRYRRPLEEMTIDGHMALLDIELMDDLSVTQVAGPDAAGAGWGATNWKRRLHQLRSESIDLNNMTVTYSTRYRRDFLCTHWDTGYSPRTSSSVEDGVARLTVGGTVTFTRASFKWIEDPGSRYVVVLGTNGKPYDYSGLLMESASTNLLTLSSNVAGSTAGITVGLGSGTFTSEAAATQPLFESGVTANNYLFTAGSPHAVTKTAAWAATASVLANTIVRFSIDYMNTGTVSADRLCYRIQRAVDANYWNDSTGAWGAGVTDNPLALASTRARGISKAINVGASNTTLTMTLTTPAGGTAARLDRIYHVQLESLAWATSRIVTTSAAVTRALETHTVTNTSGKRPLHSTGGTFMFQIVPEYTAADALAQNVDLYFLDMTYDASNWFRAYYDVSAGNLLFEIRAAGTTTTATKAWSPVRGTTYKIAARWTSSAGELDLTARTHSIFIDGVKGTDATRAGDPTRSSADMYLGGNAAGAACNGNITRHLLTQVPLSDSEIGRFAP
jgi:hypothetical protein